MTVYGIEWADCYFSDKVYESYDDVVAEIITHLISLHFENPSQALYSEDKVNEIVSYFTHDVCDLLTQGFVEDTAYIHEFDIVPKTAIK